LKGIHAAGFPYGSQGMKQKMLSGELLAVVVWLLTGERKGKPNLKTSVI
jgi:hypothetical protein